jgi:hypothetical protein
VVSGRGLRRIVAAALVGASALAAARSARAEELPQGYLVWSKGVAGEPASRKLYRLTLPGKSDERALTAGEDVEPQVSPDGRWVAYAKAKFPGGSDYHDFKLWSVYVVSIHGAAQGRKESKIDDDGAWPSWSKSGALFYNQADGTHSRLVRVELDDRGRVTRKQMVVASRETFGKYAEVNEAAMAPDESWFAARTRGNVTQNGVSAFTVNPPAAFTLARAGDIGCMPRVAPSGTFAVIAGATEGIRWGHGPQVAGRKEDQLLVPPRTKDHLAYHPGISSDERWILDAQGTEADHNSGRYDIGLAALDATTMTVTGGEVLTSSGFNGWPQLWVGAPTEPPPPSPEVSEFYASRYTVTPGEAVTLTWTTFGSDQVLLDEMAVTADGTQELEPTASVTHTLLARSSLLPAQDMRTVAIVVNDPPKPVAIARFWAEPPRIEKGQSTTLRWEVNNATTLDLDGQRAAPVESRVIRPLETTIYLLRAQGHAGPVEATVSVTVEAQQSGLLPDRGGFRCAFGAGARGAGLAAPGLLLVLALLVRRPRTRRPRRR